MEEDSASKADSESASREQQLLTQKFDSQIAELKKALEAEAAKFKSLQGKFDAEKASLQSDHSRQMAESLDMAASISRYMARSRRSSA